MWINKTFVIIMLIIAAFFALVGMIAGPLGYEPISLASLMVACIFSVVVVVFGLVQLKKRKR